MFASTMRKGFYIEFANGLHLSVQWGAGNYCDNHYPEDNDFSFSKDAKSSDAEIAVVYKKKFINPTHFVNDKKSISTDGLVSGFLSPEKVAEIMYNVSVATIDDIAEWSKEEQDIF